MSIGDILGGLGDFFTGGGGGGGEQPPLPPSDAPNPFTTPINNDPFNFTNVRPPEIPEGATDLGGGNYQITTSLPGGRVGVTTVDSFGDVVSQTVFDSSSGGGARGPTPAELQIMRDELKVRQDQLKINQGILDEAERSNLIQEDLALQELGISQGTLDEAIRSALAREEENAKDRALAAASNALTGYLRAAELSDARRLASLQLQRDFLPFQVDPSKEFFGGGPEGSLATTSQNFGLNFQPTPIQHQTVDPEGLAQIDPVTGANIEQSIGLVTQAGEA